MYVCIYLYFLSKLSASFSGAFGGKIKHISATDLAVQSSKAAIAAGNVNPAHIQEVFMNLFLN